MRDKGLNIFNPLTWSFRMRIIYTVESVILGVAMIVFCIIKLVPMMGTTAYLFLVFSILITAGNIFIASGKLADFYKKFFPSYNFGGSESINGADSQKLAEYQRLYDAGLITKAELEAKREALS